VAAFATRGVLRNPHLQSMLASSTLRKTLDRLRGTSLDESAGEQILDCGDGVWLQGFHTPAERPRGLAVLLHGWEGCHASSYVLSAGARLLSAGLSVYRLNFRDHGPTHHLNEELFHSCRLDEVVGAVRAIAERVTTRPLFLVGFSLGGNFALRVGRRVQADVAPERIVAVSPVVDPGRCLVAMERSRIYEWYFIRKWVRSLRRKQALFPRRFDFGELLREPSIRVLTRELVCRYAGFHTLEDYLDGYSIAGARLRGLEVPSTIVTAADDPIIPVEDFHRLESLRCLELDIQPRGGHVGFLERLSLRSWVDGRIVSALGVSASTGR
jgi:predicted alpha/beta-fold hydrolase